MQRPEGVLVTKQEQGDASGQHRPSGKEQEVALLEGVEIIRKGGKGGNGVEDGYQAVCPDLEGPGHEKQHQDQFGDADGVKAPVPSPPIW